MTTALTTSDGEGEIGIAPPSPPPASTSLGLLAVLSRQALATNEPREFALEAAKAAAVWLQCSHFGWAAAAADQQEVAAVVRNNPRQYIGNDHHKFTLSTAGDEALFLEAIRSGRTVTVADLVRSPAKDPRLFDWGIVSAAVVPLASAGRAPGALAVFDRSVRTFHSDHLALLESLAHLVSSTMSRCMAERDLRYQRSLNQSLSSTMESMMLVLDSDGRIASANQACCTLTGFAARDLEGRSVWSALMLPEELSQIKRAFARIQGGEHQERFDSYLLTKTGQRRRISWSITRLDGDARSRPAIVATGVDITDRCEAVERAARAETMAHNARRTLQELKQQLDSGEQSIAAPPTAHRLPSGVEHDRRARPRREYPYLQLIAPMHDAQLPPDVAFRELQCRDISSRGFSFYTAVPLNCERVVVAFGTPPSVVYLTADIRHSTEQQIDGRRMFVIGCRYAGRVTKDE